MNYCSGVYEIRNICNDKQYIGSSVDTRNRWWEHLKVLRRNKHGNRYLQRAWNKYGEDNFTFRVLLRCNSDDLLILEQAMLDANHPEYNILPKAGSCLGRRHTEEAKQMMSLAHKGNQVWLGRKHTEETKKKMRGERNHRARLTDDDVRDIRRLYTNGEFTTHQLGEIFGVGHQHISRIVLRQQWTHI